MGFLTELTERAARDRLRIAFPESHDPRVLEAVELLARERIVEPVLIQSQGARVTVPRVEVVDPATDPRHARAAADLLAARADRGLGADAAERLGADPLFFGVSLVRHGDVAGCVAGCDTTTADVIRAALWLVGRAPDVRTVSSAFYMVPPAFRGHGEDVLTFTDCGVVRYPTADQLADIAVNAVRDRRRVVGDEPVVAFLSFSTRGSAEGESVDLVRQAVRLTTSRLPDCAVDGELQVDAALIDAIARRKAPESRVAGRANVLVFPSLDAGNIGYKLVERLAGAAAIGPILQGLARPCNDLSRGASVDDIIRTAAVTALQARRGDPLEG
jgi:phosphate acetyltransferase